MNADLTLDGVALDGSRAPLAEKRAALAELVRACLARHADDFVDPDRVATSVDARALLNASEADARRLMGTPARYAEVLWRGGTSDAVALMDGAQAFASHSFLCHVYWGAGEGSEDEFTAAMEGADEWRPGLLVALRHVSHVRLASGAVVEVGAPSDVRATLVHARPSVPGLAGYQHEAAFLITLT